jgi:hypothetical protein
MCRSEALEKYSNKACEAKEKALLEELLSLKKERE